MPDLIPAKLVEALVTFLGAATVVCYILGALGFVLGLSWVYEMRQRWRH